MKDLRVGDKFTVRIRTKENNPCHMEVYEISGDYIKLHYRYENNITCGDGFTSYSSNRIRSMFDNKDWVMINCMPKVYLDEDLFTL